MEGWKGIKLNDAQNIAYDALQSRLDEGALKGTICLIGGFLSGKTSLIKRYLADRFGQTDDCYLNVNLYLLEQLKKSGSLSTLALTKAKTRSMMQESLETTIGEHFERHDILVLDAIEIIYPYNLNLASITDKCTRDGKICIICVPEDRQRGFMFDFSWGMCEVIRLS